jgi:hypothetical protein
VKKVISCLVQTTIKAIPFSYLHETIVTHVSISIYFGKKNREAKAVALKKQLQGHPI